MGLLGAIGQLYMFLLLVLLFLGLGLGTWSVFNYLFGEEGDAKKGPGTRKKL